MKRFWGLQTHLARTRPQLPQSRLTQGLRYVSSETKANRAEYAEIQDVDIVDNGLSIRSSNPHVRKFLPGIWLRDNCRCKKCVNQDTMQRNLDTFEIKASIRPEMVKTADYADGVTITWPDKHVSRYPWSFLNNYLRHDYRELDNPSPKFFTRDAAQSPPSVDYNNVMLPDDSGVADLLNKIKIHGFAFVDNTPYEDPQDTKRLLERIAFIRETHYGGFYDFTPDLSIKDTAYTNLALPAHTDTTYFTDPAGLQSFHLLSHTPAPTSAHKPATDESTTDGESASQGGASLLVDGFAVADFMKKRYPKAYKILSKVRLPWHASGNKGITIAPDKRYPVFEHDPDTGSLHRVRWNNDDRGVVPWDDEYSPEQWYEAARTWNTLLNRDQKFQCWIQLRPGRVLIFDNWRVLHGRSAFQGIRRICGAYINRDDWISRWRNTNLQPREIQKIIGY